MSSTFSNLFRNSSEGDFEAAVSAPLPASVRGKRFVFNGPVGMWDFEKGSAKHFFDGMSMLVSFSVSEDGERVSMKKRFLKSDAYRKALSNGRPITTEYGTPSAPDPDRNIVSRVLASLVPGEMTDNCACAVYQVGSSTAVAATETSLLRPFDPSTLETGPDCLDLSGLVNVASARAKRDPDTGDVFNIAGTFNSGIKYHFIRFPAEKVSNNSEVKNMKDLAKMAEIHSTIPSRMKTCFSYYHSFAMTKNYLLMVEQPWVANSLKLLASKIQGLSFKDCLEWHPEERNRFHLVEKRSGRRVKTCYMSRDPFFFLNFASAREEGDSVVVDIVAYDSPDILDRMYLSELRGPSGNAPMKHPGSITRFVLPIVKEKNQEENLVCFAEGEELSKIPGASARREKKTVWVEGKKSKEIGGCEHPVAIPVGGNDDCACAVVCGWLNTSGAFAHSLSKMDLEADGGAEILSSWRGSDFQHPSEAIYVPPAEGEGGSGVLVSAVRNEREKEKDFLLFLDARNMSEVARAEFGEEEGAKIPLVSHGAMMMVSQK